MADSSSGSPCTKKPHLETISMKCQNADGTLVKNPQEKFYKQFVQFVCDRFYGDQNFIQYQLTKD